MASLLKFDGEPVTAEEKAMRLGWTLGKFGTWYLRLGNGVHTAQSALEAVMKSAELNIPPNTQL